MNQFVKNPNKVKAGKRSRALGSQFELRVRKDLIEKGWIVDKWSNNVEFKPTEAHNKDGTRVECYFGKLIPAKAKWAGPGRPMMMGAGFPDFIVYKFMMGFPKKEDEELLCTDGYNDTTYEGYQIIGVESKMTGKLDKEEKQKCDWLLKNNIFSKILIASKHKIKNRIHIEYNEYKTAALPKGDPTK